MNTTYLKEFVTLAETKNFWEASERLFMNQSTLSKHIKALEVELGVELFSRSTRHVELTSYGETFLPYAAAMVRTELEGITALKHLENIENGLLTIGTIPSIPQYNITQLLSEFQKLYPETTIKIIEDDPINLLHYLENEKCELIFNREDKTSLKNSYLSQRFLTHIPYMKDKLVAVVKKTHPLAKEKSITLQQLKDEHFCFIKEETFMYNLSTSSCQNAGFIPDVIFTSHRIDSILDMVKNQSCVALLMDKHLDIPIFKENASRPLTQIPITPTISSQINLCYRNDKPLSDSAKLFLEFMQEKQSLK